MPRYCYTNRKTGNTIERWFAMGQAPDKVVAGRLVYYRDVVADFQTRVGRGLSYPSTYPMTSTAMGVHESQVPAAEAEARKHGLDIHFTKDGDAIFNNATERRKYVRLYGHHDRNAGYSDPVPD